MKILIGNVFAAKIGIDGTGSKARRSGSGNMCMGEAEVEWTLKNVLMLRDKV